MMIFTSQGDKPLYLQDQTLPLIQARGGCYTPANLLGGACHVLCGMYQVTGLSHKEEKEFSATLVLNFWRTSQHLLMTVHVR